MPLEDKYYIRPVVALYDTDLRFTGKVYAVPQSHMPWIALDQHRRLTYSSEFDGVDELYVYDISSFKLIRKLKLDRGLSRVQGGIVYRDELFLSCDDGDNIYLVDLGTGRVEQYVKISGGYEMEGLDYRMGRLYVLVATHGESNLLYSFKP